ncbi:Dynamin family protein [Candida albicans]|uniref:Dynamin family protein n=1 Tax=Candida albicans TaxID=5476 RepID=A0A8H6C363_CANAX|nr:Dynamin family protein [Candida albicans]
MGDFPNLEPDKRIDQNSHSDTNSVNDQASSTNDSVLSTSPSRLVYIPGESSLTRDGPLPLDGEEGSSSQSQYNNNKIALDSSINQTIDLISELQDENKERPIFYPTEIEDDASVVLNSAKAHLALVRKNSTLKSISKSKIETDEKELPEFKILKISLKSGHGDNSNTMANLDKKSIANLLEKKLLQQVKYLLNLKDRIDDTTSKVFVTGDLNAGKSTFCNALLRRKILPEDQQPCTAVFCEVIDASKENNSIEEVHAVPIGKEYNIRDESTFEVYPLESLEDLVYDCDRFSLLKIYVLDHRSFQESLLHNGVIDIKLIDAPGLNMDSYQTTQVFSRQEEIDLVVFVVSAENHFTLSAKEFIAAAANEKRYVFIVVNRFDHIKDKEKCKRRILDQIKSLSPDTYKNAKEFVHFVSSSEVLNENGGGDDGDPDDDDNNNNDNNDHPDFDQLEASLRKFLLEKRSISKLLPVKDYLLNILLDLQTLSKINEKIYYDEKVDKLQELNNRVAPKYNDIMTKSVRIGDTINGLIESTCTEVYNETNKEIVTTVNNLGDKPIVKYPGLQYLFEYAKETQLAMIDIVLESVARSEEVAKKVTSNRVDEIIKYGQQTLNEEFLNDKVFNSDLMFTRRRDTIGKSIDDTFEINDFFDPSIESFLVFVGLPEKFVKSAKYQISYFNPVGMLTSIPQNAVTLKEQLPSQLTLHTLYSSSKILTTGALVHKMITIYYLLSDIPNALPRNQARKIKKQIGDLDYAHQNSARISRECRQVLNYPARQVMNNFQTSIDKRSNEKAELEKVIKDAEISSGFFKNLLTKVERQQGLLKEIDLESINFVE